MTYIFDGFQISPKLKMSGASGVKAEMDELIQSKAVLLISKSYCPYCKKAKQVLVKCKRRRKNTNKEQITNTSTNTHIH